MEEEIARLSDQAEDRILDRAITQEEQKVIAEEERVANEEAEEAIDISSMKAATREAAAGADLAAAAKEAQEAEDVRARLEEVGRRLSGEQPPAPPLAQAVVGSETAAVAAKEGAGEDDVADLDDLLAGIQSERARLAADSEAVHNALDLTQRTKWRDVSVDNHGNDTSDAAGGWNAAGDNDTAPYGAGQVKAPCEAKPPLVDGMLTVTLHKLTDLCAVAGTGQADRPPDPFAVLRLQGPGF